MAANRNEAAPSLTLSRRGFLVAAAGTGVAFSFLSACSKETPHSATAYEPTLWYAIDADGIVTVNVIRVEMGQHVGTSLARILADELEVPWENVLAFYEGVQRYGGYEQK